MRKDNYTEEAKVLLGKLIETSSFSGQEEGTAAILEAWMLQNGVEFNRSKNNVWATNRHFDPEKPTLLLNSHHDTVQPNKGYTHEPFHAKEENGKLFGLGSNDAGGALVSLLFAFRELYDANDLSHNVVIATTGEEENSGENGLRSVLKELPEIDLAIVGEPTNLDMAVAERGLLVVDGYAKGIPGHAAHENTVNPIYSALDDIQKIQNLVFDEVSEVLGAVKVSVTQINAGTQHNQVPEACHFVIDVRFNEYYSAQSIFETLDRQTESTLVARSFKHQSSGIPSDHFLMDLAEEMGMKTYGSPTLSDQTALSCPSIKIGPGQSSRSHTADEFILLEELEQGITTLIKLTDKICRK